MNTQHFKKVKSTCDFLQSIDRNSSWSDMYSDWINMDNEERLIEIQYLQSTLIEYLKNENDEYYINKFKSELVDIRKIELEILEVLNE